MLQTIFILASDVWQSVHLLQVDRQKDSVCVRASVFSFNWQQWRFIDVCVYEQVTNSVEQIEE